MQIVSRVLAVALTGLRRQSGQTMVEYGILIAVIALVVIVGALLLGSSVSAVFSSASHKV